MIALIFTVSVVSFLVLLKDIYSIAQGILLLK